VTGGRCDEARPDLAIVADRISDNEMVIFEDSSHLASIEDRELYLRTIDEFLARVEADGVSTVTEKSGGTAGCCPGWWSLEVLAGGQLISRALVRSR
jgi:hypothetical protein